MGCTNKKVKLGQFFTSQSIWLKPQIVDFIKSSCCSVCYDPFAGGGDLLNVANTSLGFKNCKGLDIDKSLGWEYNDSLLNIPHIDNAIILTNPPYIAKHSASRKDIDLKKYFDISSYDDVYLIALDRMLASCDNVVAIIPESFINSNYKNKNRLNCITILEENPFTDTENPVCVVCFDKIYKDGSRIKIYKNEKYINTLDEINKCRLIPKKNVNISFNSLSGWLGIRAVDSTDDKRFINFDFMENIPYDWEHNIKVTSRHFTLVDIDIPIAKRIDFVKICNSLLLDLRKKTSDILLTPFKGNTKSGKRRRRLDFALARAIMEKAYEKVRGNHLTKRIDYDEYRLFSL